MTKNKDPNKEILAEIIVDPDVLARELALDLEIDPLEQIDEDAFSKDLNITQECNDALKLLKGNREERIQGLRIFCEYRDSRSFPLLLPLLDQPCPVERMSVVYALGRNPCPSAVEKLVSLLETDDNAYVRRATAWSLANYDNQIVLKPLINALKNDVAAVRLWSSSSLAEIGNVSLENAQLAAEQLLISLKIDNEPGVRSNCIWSLCRLYEKLNNTFGEDIIVVQIAGLVARRIVTETLVDQDLKQGDRIGMIRFGSRADLYFENYKPLVKVDQKMIAGETLIAKR